ncbi:MAG TPA: TetR family transcriptional regulator [Thermoanaerobaculia bacterium]|jgi:AcrR family transcriptional regulator|nr:TetR family transcriptional regulator [Thermoanaerobaculia bacterium]
MKKVPLALDLDPEAETEEGVSPEASSHDRLLQAARVLFAQQGYENTTTSAISRRAGTSESQLIKHFGSKEGLLEAIFDQGWKRMEGGLREVLSREGRPVDRLHAVTGLLIDAFERDPELRTLMLLEGRRIRRHGHMVILTRGFLKLVGVVDEVLREMREAGQIRPDLSVDAVRSALIGAIEGLLRDQLLAERGSYPARYDGAELRRVFQALLEGLLSSSRTAL